MPINPSDAGGEEMAGMPPLSLSSGPAVSGGPTTANGGASGAFYVQRKADWKAQLAAALPYLVIGGAVFWVYRK